MITILDHFNSRSLYPGRMISAYKTAPKGHVCVFNANVFTGTGGKIWYGDLDLTKDHKKLVEIATTLGEPLYVLREMDGRFKNEFRPFEEVEKVAIAKIEPEKA
jgi:hypothetical protein